MKPRTIGPDLLAKDSRGHFQNRIATVFPHEEVVVTLPGTHGTQVLAFLEILEEEHRKAGLGDLAPEERDAVFDRAVDLVLEGDAIQIRPNARQMQLAFAADELLQRLVSKWRIRFLNVLDDRVHEAIKRRGECWRITPLPRCTEGIQELIAASRIGISGWPIYYYNSTTGTRLLTCQEFARLGDRPEPELRNQLAEIREYCQCVNRQKSPEVDFFLAEPSFRAELVSCDFLTLDGAGLRAVHQRLSQQFTRAVPVGLRDDDLNNPTWRQRMFSALVPCPEDRIAEEELLGLSSEFYLHVQWLPGGRVEEGELIFDSVFEETGPEAAAAHQKGLSDDKARGFIFNFVREYGDLEYVNVGKITEPLSGRTTIPGRRGVYLVEMKLRDQDEEILKILRLQKWGVGERLDEKQGLLEAIIGSEEYTEFILDRRLGCRQLGMNLPTRVTTRRIVETYSGEQRAYHGTRIWTSYFERDYLCGIATNKIPPARFKDKSFAVRFAVLLGRAAAPNMIVGRCNVAKQVIFDDGDEVILEDEQGMPVDLVVADHTGAFRGFDRPLSTFAPSYAERINKRAATTSDPQAFADAYLDAWQTNFLRIREEYRRRRRAFDTLFRHQPRDERGNFAYRWEQVLKRLDATDVEELERAIREKIGVSAC